MTDTVAQDKVVLLHYTLTNADGEELDSSRGGEPLPYLHGHANIVPGLERALTGAAVGSKHHVVVAPADGYGEASGVDPQPIPRTAFPADAPLQEGMQFATQTEDGHIIPLWVVSTDDEHVYITTDHPLAGVELHFDVEIVEVRDASPAEVTQGHVQ